MGLKGLKRVYMTMQWIIAESFGEKANARRKNVGTTG